MPGWHEGYMVVLDADDIFNFEIIPYIQSDSIVGAGRMSKNEEEAFRLSLQEMSARIRDVDFVERQWLEFCKDKRYVYFSFLRGHNRLLRVLNRLVHFSDWFYSRSELTTLRHVIRCETLVEVLNTVLSNS
jgi:hypothetical protein